MFRKYYTSTLIINKTLLGLDGLNDIMKYMKAKKTISYIFICVACLGWIYSVAAKFKEDKIPESIAISKCQPYINEHLQLVSNLINIESQPKYIKLRNANYRRYNVGKDTLNNINCKTYYYKSEKNHTWRQIWINEKTKKIIAKRDWTAYNQLKSSENYSNLQNKILKIAVPEKLKSPNIWLPKGYTFFSSDSTNEYNHFTYYDGLNLISVFDCKHSPKLKVGCYNWNKGLICVKKNNNKFIVVVSDLPENEIKEITESLM